MKINRLYFLQVVMVGLFLIPQQLFAQASSFQSAEMAIRTSVYSSWQELQRRPDEGDLNAGAIEPVYCQKNESGFLIFANYGYYWPLIIQYDPQSKKSQFTLWDGWGKKDPESGGQDKFWGKTWQFVGRGFKHQDFFAVLDHAVEGAGQELLVIDSQNGGKDWQLRSLFQKPTYTAYFNDFVLDSEGRGFLAVDLEGSSPDFKNTKRFYPTSDAAKSWGRALKKRPQTRNPALKKLPNCPGLAESLRLENAEQLDSFLKKLR